MSEDQSRSGVRGDLAPLATAAFERDELAAGDDAHSAGGEAIAVDRDLEVTGACQPLQRSDAHRDDHAIASRIARRFPPLRALA